MKFLSWLKRTFRRWGYHENPNSKVVNYTPGKRGVYGRHIDWTSILKHTVIWLLVIIFLVIIADLLIHTLAIIIILAVFIFVVGKIWWLFCSRKSGTKR